MTPFLSVQAQNIICGHDLVMEKIGQDRAYIDDVNAVYTDARMDKIYNRFENVYTIPVTFHVVWKEDAENLDDSLLYQQIDVLNEDYRRLNEDSDNIRDIFADAVGDTYIEFELKEIIRVKTATLFEVDLTSNELLDYIKLNEDGGSPAVNGMQNLNIWICNIQPLNFQGIELGNLLGYAYPPANLSHWPPNSNAPSEDLEGVVLDYRVIGRNNPNELTITGFDGALEMKGRTAVHEIGHYLGLRHIWGDASAFDDGCTMDDGLQDTPNCSTQSSFDCDMDKNTCIDTIGIDLPDMIENFMDYAAESCMNSFTHDQIGVMRSVLRNQRCELVGDCIEVATNTILSKNISIYPNPAKNIINIKNETNEQIDLTILNALGQSVAKHNSVTGSIDISTFQNGVYFFKLKMENSSLTTKVIVEK